MNQPFRNEDEATAAMLRSTQCWPKPILPVKNRREQVDGWPKLGLVAMPGEPVTIWIGTLFTGPTGEKVTYPTVEAAMAAGWVVD